MNYRQTQTETIMRNTKHYPLTKGVQKISKNLGATSKSGHQKGNTEQCPNWWPTIIRYPVYKIQSPRTPASLFKNNLANPNPNPVPHISLQHLVVKLPIKTKWLLGRICFSITTVSTFCSMLPPSYSSPWDCTQWAQWSSRFTKRNVRNSTKCIPQLCYNRDDDIKQPSF
jgi:hypothetical protein